jgi:acyl-CoA synthetase (AMP-forming)/AMP-acid ligase II/acyl carrier protein
MSSTIVSLLFAHAQSIPDAVAFRYLQDLESPPQELSYKSLWQEAGAIADFLSSVASPGSRIMLFFPPGMAYIKAFYGCLLAGMVAVPLYPPRRNIKSDRIFNVAQSCQSGVALTTQSELANVQASWNEQNSLGLSFHFYATDGISGLTQEVFFCPDIELATPAFLQYTSGSTGTPKGVIITHANIIANVSHLSLMSGGSKEDVFVNWLPLFHDLGLITAVLWPIYLGASSTLMAPATFVRNPIMWLNAISRYRGSMCGSPNFAYDLCTNKIADADLPGLDLSSWRVAYNAAEPVRAETLNNFSARFSVCGFNAEAFYPGYGMAEATVFITGGDSSVKPTQLNVNKKMIAEHKLELVDEDDATAIKMVACGTALPPHDVRIVNPDTGCELVSGKVGEIWFAGPSVSLGYWGLPELTNATFNQKIVGQDANPHRYLKTGDLGVIWGNELFVTGRIKDLIILRGRNYYPQDIEDSATSAHMALRRGYCAAFSVLENDIEKLVVVAELEREYFRTVDANEVVSVIRHSVVRDHEVNVDQVVLLKPYKIPVTSSGKIQRSRTKQLLLNQELDLIAQSSFENKNDYVAPVSEAECTLFSIWCVVLERDRISVTDNFFDIGGSSLSALEISAEVRKKFPLLSVDIEQLLEFPTIRQLAQFLEIKMAHAKSKQTPLKLQQRRVVII